MQIKRTQKMSDRVWKVLVLVTCSSLAAYNLVSDASGQSIRFADEASVSSTVQQTSAFEPRVNSAQSSPRHDATQQNTALRPAELPTLDPTPLTSEEGQPIQASNLTPATTTANHGKPRNNPPRFSNAGREPQTVQTSAGLRPQPAAQLASAEDMGVIPDAIIDALPAPVSELSTTGTDISSGLPVQHPMPVDGQVIEGQMIDGQVFDGPIMEGPAAAAIQEHPTAIFSTNDWFRSGFWYTEQSVKLLLKTDIPAVVFGGEGLATDPFTGDPFFALQEISAKQATFTYEAGADLTIGRFLGRDISNRDHALEFTFMGLFDYTGRAQIEADTQALLTFITPSPGVTRVLGFGPADVLALDWESSLDSYELNFRVMSRPGRDRMALQPNGRWIRHSSPSKLKSFLIGFRSVHLEEDLLFRGEGTAQDATNQLFFEEGSYSVRVDNELYGLQLGFDTREKFAKATWGVGVKAAGLFNFARRESRLDTLSRADITGDILTQNRDQDIRDENLTLLLEVGVDGAYYLRPNFALRASYDLLYLQGVGSAPENAFLGPTFPRFELTGDALYHGLSLGFEMVW